MQAPLEKPKDMTPSQYAKANREKLILEIGQSTFDGQLKSAKQSENATSDHPLEFLLRPFYNKVMLSEEDSSSFLLAHKDELIGKWG